MVPSPTWRADPSRAPSKQAAPEPDASESASLMGRFAAEHELLCRHVRILSAVRENEPVGIIKLSELTGHPQHKVRYSLRVLEQEGLIEPSSLGARTTPLVKEFVPQLEALIGGMQKAVDELKGTLQ